MMNEINKENTILRPVPYGKLVPVLQRNESAKPRSINEVLDAIEDFPQDIQDKFINDFYSGAI